MNQAVLDALAGQPQLEALDLKWGNYSDLAPIGRMHALTTLRLRGAGAVSDLSPLSGLSSLRELVLDEVHADPSPLSDLNGLVSLSYGNGYPGSDRVVRIAALSWVAPLRNLEVLRFPGTAFDDPDFSVLASLPALRELFIPLRRRYRKQVFELARVSAPFRALADLYEDAER